MNHGPVKLFFWPLIFCTLAGCDRIGNLGRDPAERINEAYPAGAAVISATSRLESLMTADEAALTSFRQENAGRSKLRAVTCAENYEPSWLRTTQGIREDLDKPECFETFDADQVRWLNHKRLVLLVSAPPLRPIPENPPAILTSSQSIQSAEFADEAGVGIFVGNRSIEVVDVGTDKSIFLDSEPGNFTQFVSISPNGRVFSAVGRANDDEGTRLRDAETGETLIEYPDVLRFEWLDQSAALTMSKDTRRSEILDIRTGKSVPAKGFSSMPTSIFRNRGASPAFVAQSQDSLTRFELRNEQNESQIRILSQLAVPPVNRGANRNALSTDGRYMVQGSGQITISDLETRQTDQILIAPHSVVHVSPLPAPDEMLVAIAVRGNASVNLRFFVLNLSDRTFAPAENDAIRVPEQQRSLTGTYINSLHRTGIISGSTITLLDQDLPRGFKLGLQAFTQHLSEHAPEEAALHGGTESSRRFSAGNPLATGDLQQSARNAQIEAVGVYRSDLAPSRPGQAAGRGRVSVLVRSSPRPVVLVLSSYDPVDWVIQLAPGAQLQAVLMSSYEESTVQGAGSARVLQMGRMYAYERGSEGFNSLQREVIRWAGKPIDTFQGRYQARSFSVGGF